MQPKSLGDGVDTEGLGTVLGEKSAERCVAIEHIDKNSFKLTMSTVNSNRGSGGGKNTVLFEFMKSFQDSTHTACNFE